MSLRRLLTWLILLCTGPLVILAIILAVFNVMDKLADRDIAAANLLNSFASVIDEDLRARIAALHMLAESSLVDDPSHWKDLYKEAQGFHNGFGSHVIFADTRMHMLFNTRVPFGSKLPILPRPKGRSAVATVLATGKPAVGDIFFGPLAKEPLIAIAVPAVREGKTAFFLLTIFETRRYQERIDQVSLSPRWSLALLDGKGEAIIRRAPRENVDNSKQIILKSKVSTWSMVLGMPRDNYSTTMINSVTAMVIAVFSIILVSLLGALLISRHMGKAVASLTETPTPGARPPGIAEIAAVRRLLDESTDKRRQSEAALKESEKKYRLIADNADDWIYWISPEGTLQYVSPSCERVTGYSAAELTQQRRPLMEIVHPDDLDMIRDHTGRIEDDRSDYLEFRILTKDGKLRWISHSCSPIYSEDGQYAGRLGTNRNITERKQAEENLRTYQDHLEELIRERTNELARANLSLRELDRLKSLFIASMSHELRTPLNSIIGFTGIVLMGMSGPLTETQQKQLGMVKGSARHLLDLINDVIDVSKIESGKTDLNIENFELSAVIRDVAESFAVAAQAKGLQLEFQAGGEITVASDRRRVRQILVNLVGNAIKFTESGGVTIAASAQEEFPARITTSGTGAMQPGADSSATASGTIQISVRDTGVGMTPQDMEKLFEAFSRIYIQGRPVVEGTGLGLYLSRRIAGLLGGEITVTSEAGRGSTFIFSLPGAYQGADHEKDISRRG